ncbi:M48 family metallopeptidase [Coraliomargarita parva]|uniref:M48 family metallopeptidase n=1 Tax=Coraliomargarita parva TaxID=3014050 RepID=UPI0022B5C2F1|nr:SprT family zinc-dependent metalloprotease [Coraliomargarita parva]
MKPAAPIYVSIRSRQVPVEIRRRKGARNMRLSIGHQNQIVASVPWRCPHRETIRFVIRHEEWLATQLREAPAACSIYKWLRKHPRLTACGDLFTVRFEAVPEIRGRYTFDNGGADVVLHLPRSQPPVDAAHGLVRGFAKDALACRVAYHSKRLRLDYTKLSVRDQSSRWGSCTEGGSLSLNWRLVLLAPELQDYVILHELAHLTELNHSKRFWTLLERYDPQRKQHEEALDLISPVLMRVGRIACDRSN